MVWFQVGKKILKEGLKTKAGKNALKAAKKAVTKVSSNIFKPSKRTKILRNPERTALADHTKKSLKRKEIYRTKVNNILKVLHKIPEKEMLRRFNKAEYDYKSAAFSAAQKFKKRFKK